MVQVDFQKGEFNHILENTIDVVMSVYHIPKTNIVPKINIMYHNHTFGGFKDKMVVLHESHEQLLHQTTFKRGQIDHIVPKKIKYNGCCGWYIV